MYAYQSLGTAVRGTPPKRPPRSPRQLSALFARLDTRNAASIRLCERLAMRREAHLIDSDLEGTEWSSEYVYAVLADEFINRR
jgi:RimJ/RimL family protein N-acetyltransferase